MSDQSMSKHGQICRTMTTRITTLRLIVSRHVLKSNFLPIFRLCAPVYSYIYIKIPARGLRCFGVFRASWCKCAQNHCPARKTTALCANACKYAQMLQIRKMRAPESARRSCSRPRSVPQGARMGCSSPRSVPRGRSKALLEPPLGGPRALEWAARAPTWCPRMRKGAVPASTRCSRCARRGCSSLLGAPCVRRTAFRAPARCCRGFSSYLLDPWALEKAFENAV